MKIKLVFDDWRKNGESVYQTEKGIDLSYGAAQFHSGTMFNAEIDLTEGDSKELQRALKQGYEPVFYVIEEKQNKDTK